jgi:hypothetical protein
LLLFDKLRSFVNDAFLNYIFEVEKYDLESYFKGLFKKEDREKNYLLIIRVNLCEEFEVVGKVDLDNLIEKAQS